MKNPIFNLRIRDSIVLPFLFIIFLVESTLLLPKCILYVDKLYYDSLLEQMSYEKIQKISDQAALLHVSFREYFGLI